MDDRKDELSEEEKESILQNLNEKALDEAINILKKNAQEEADEDIKNSIGNLTLLDANTTGRMAIACSVRRDESSLSE